MTKYTCDSTCEVSDGSVYHYQLMTKCSCLLMHTTTPYACIYTCLLCRLLNFEIAKSTVNT